VGPKANRPAVFESVRLACSLSRATSQDRSQEGPHAFKTVQSLQQPLSGSLLVAPAAYAQAPAKKPNILVIFGDDVGQTNISAYSMGVVGYQHAQHRPHRQGRHAVHGLLRREQLHRRPLDVHHRQSASAPASQGRHPGAKWACRSRHHDRRALKPLGYATGQFGKNHLGDRDEFLPTHTASTSSSATSIT
jgi:arylsulfatase